MYSLSWALGDMVSMNSVWLKSGGICFTPVGSRSDPAEHSRLHLTACTHRHRGASPPAPPHRWGTVYFSTSLSVLMGSRAALKLDRRGKECVKKIYWKRRERRGTSSAFLCWVQHWPQRAGLYHVCVSPRFTHCSIYSDPTLLPNHLFLLFISSDSNPP